MTSMTQPAPSPPRIIAFGEALTDMLRQPDNRWQAIPGGSSWNVARALCSLGLPAAFAGAVSNDLLGDQIVTASEASGLDTRFIQRAPYSPLLAMVDPMPTPRYFFIGDNSADLYFDPTQLPAGWMEELEWAHFGGISLAREPLTSRLIELAEMLKSLGRRISYDPNYRLLMDARYDSTLERMCQLADVIKVSDEDLCGLFRCTDPAPGVAQLRAWAPQAWLLRTSGEDGTTLYRGSNIWQARLPRVEVIDTVGAGDAAMAGLIYSLYSCPDLAGPERHLASAIAAGTAACMSEGAVPPSSQITTALRELIVPSSLRATHEPPDTTAGRTSL